MENASKALLIAGGVLLAVLVLSLFGLLLSNISSNQMAQEKIKQAEQLKEFNQQWEAYNKKTLYGTDIITVMNKAIENNNNLETSIGFVNIRLKIKKDYIYRVEVYNDGSSLPWFSHDNRYSPCLKAGKEYSLVYFEDPLFMDPSVIEIFENPEKKTKVYKELKGSNTQYFYDELIEFKKAFFKCTGVVYEDGRVKELVFEEQE